MVTLITRAQIGLRAPEGRRYLSASKVENVAIHWPGSAKIINAVGDAGLARIKSALRGWQAYHMDGRGWSDIAYQVAVDNVGRAYDLRGVAVQSAANGDQDVNVRFGAILWILGPGEQPSAAMINTTKAVLDMFRAKFSRVPDRPTWHGKIRPGGGTDCPGPAARSAISAGKVDGSPSTPTKPTTPTTPAPVKDWFDMATQADLEAVLKRVVPGLVKTEISNYMALLYTAAKNGTAGKNHEQEVGLLKLILTNQGADSKDIDAILAKVNEAATGDPVPAVPKA